MGEFTDAANEEEARMASHKPVAQATAPTQGAPSKHSDKPYTQAGKAYLEALTIWLQDTRLMSEAIYRLYQDYQGQGRIQFSEPSWPKPKKGAAAAPLPPFAISPIGLAQRMDSLLKALWATRFVFLETLWEEYLEELVVEIRHRDSTLFEPFCEKDFMAGLIRDVLTGQLDSVDDIKNEAAIRLAAGLTRQSWDQQWKQLQRLQIGLDDKDSAEPWFPKLDEYFEIRNCIVHCQGRVSKALLKKSTYYAGKESKEVEVWPAQLDFYRHQFIACLMHIEKKFRARFAA